MYSKWRTSFEMRPPSEFYHCLCCSTQHSTNSHELNTAKGTLYCHILHRRQPGCAAVASTIALLSLSSPGQYSSWVRGVSKTSATGSGGLAGPVRLGLGVSRSRAVTTHGNEAGCRGNWRMTFFWTASLINSSLGQLPMVQMKTYHHDFQVA